MGAVTKLKHKGGNYIFTSLSILGFEKSQYTQLIIKASDVTGPWLQGTGCYLYQSGPLSRNIKETKLFCLRIESIINIIKCHQTVKSNHCSDVVFYNMKLHIGNAVGKKQYEMLASGDS